MKLYNTLTRQVDELQPLTPGLVKIYTCGLTVYSQPHIGNWLGYMYWDVLVRTLLAQGYRVERTQNITDVGHLTSDDDSGEDKMEKGAKREGITAWDVAAKYIAIADEEANMLGLLPPTHLARATDYIVQQIEFAKTLEANGFTYIIPEDGLYFDTSKLADYGKLAQLDVSGLEAGARVSVEGKKNITDFAIWKFSPVDTKRDMEWDSPWGVGFPGWHLECSVIARETLGDQIDIHTGGIDHIPVHHTNEIAQTEAVTGKQFSQFWLHVNHIKSDGQKMSKSLGNIYTLQDIVDHSFDMDAFKVFALSKHYRTEGNFTWENLEAAQNRLQHWREAMALRWQQDEQTNSTGTANAATFGEELMRRLENDLDTPSALRLIDEASDAILNGKAYGAYIDSIAEKVSNILGIHLAETDITKKQKAIIAERESARTHKDWATSDKLRDQLAEQGVGIRDNASGATWYRLTSTTPKD